MVKSHDLIHSDAVDKGTRNDNDARKIVTDKTITNYISTIPRVVERSTEFITVSQRVKERLATEICSVGRLASQLMLDKHILI